MLMNDPDLHGRVVGADTCENAFRLRSAVAGRLVTKANWLWVKIKATELTSSNFRIRFITGSLRSQHKLVTQEQQFTARTNICTEC
jgi:hypothetical protein